MELIACSVDGTVAYLQFSPEELGTPLTIEEKVGAIFCPHVTRYLWD